MSPLHKASEAYKEKDFKEAFKWYKKSAELGDATGMNLLGSMYYLGQGTLKDDKEAFKWYKKSAELELLGLGDTKGMLMLGVMYYRGQGTLKNPQLAKYWIKKAYEAGNKDAEKAWNSLALWSARP